MNSHLLQASLWSKGKCGHLPAMPSLDCPCADTCRVDLDNDKSAIILRSVKTFPCFGYLLFTFFVRQKVVILGSFEDSLSPGFLDTLKKPIYYCRKLLNIFCYIHDYLCFVSPENISHSIELFCALTITKDLSRYMKEGSIRFQLIHTFSWAARLPPYLHILIERETCILFKLR